MEERHLNVGIDENHEEHKPQYRSSGQDLNAVSAENEAGIPTIQLRHPEIF
jgi:hypothetical protein